ncbi:60S ribosomal protein L29 (macronuclear) [Tetrahymena thermophila SB210]|uniref:Large ribosomal subunit protein eL29 n=2 Tax=Tetrahymena thermophila TaxID=5911 RepID=RL29_TETTH|nr:60S ribosomal protein L29 [Tetrahymena thermophila SB210]P0DJ21.1 RecName: Full=Large ribosomal subunit protein eL29; AltName: Full=60S ribosomal protein L29 [Tetrahymena thermophila]4V8P_AT Chain AT, RPL29 [Tetrahymena thermophila]4V8P_DT Chain DT, RPL29 [Tetrahymena thermophila]4V8P_FT Chain FT, RPL29 [Tetrahymena thermophila]4V8P_HT Chain HT, RPL29 [Tetrahymena thermophila]EAS07088.2 60S ribosomal protein L29 [Tetrahymena thermophila SB210]|eukprot:XP_001027330.2 60S ribosomal protein L29 [Tetrahymena thermophila SB210]
MAKSKNSTNKNQISKSHRNGIKKPKDHRHISTKGVNPRFLRNRRRAIKNDPSIKKSKNLEKKVNKE